MFNISLLLSAAVIIICVLANKLSNKIGMPVLIAFIALGMVFGSDGILKIPFELYLQRAVKCYADDSKLKLGKNLEKNKKKIRDSKYYKELKL